MRSYHEKNQHGKRAGRVAQGVGPEFKPQYHKKERERKKEERKKETRFFLGTHLFPQIKVLKLPTVFYID
jgi:hypothetical protein